MAITIPKIMLTKRKGMAILRDSIKVWFIISKISALSSIFFPFPYRKLLTTLEKSRFHPSTVIKSKSLKGIDTMAGGNITIPIAIRVVDTTTSIKRKGK